MVRRRRATKAMPGPWHPPRQQCLVRPTSAQLPPHCELATAVLVPGAQHALPCALRPESRAVTCFCCMTSPAECWTKDVGTTTAGLSANRRWLWHICFSCQSVRRALEVRDDGCGNSIYFKVCVFFLSFFLNKHSLFAVCVFRNNLHCSGPIHWLCKTRLKLKLHTIQCGAFPKALTFLLLLSSKMLTAYLAGLTTAEFCLHVCQIFILAGKKTRSV